MPKCKKCGAHMAQDELFCPSCKTKRAEKTHENINETLKNFNKTSDYTRAYSSGDINENKIFAVLCYIPFVCLYPVFAVARKSAYVKFHANQGLVLFLSQIIIAALLWLAEFALGLIPFVGAILAFPFSVLSWAIELLMFAAIVYGIYLAALGKAREMPIIGKIKILK